MSGKHRVNIVNNVVFLSFGVAITERLSNASILRGDVASVVRMSKINTQNQVEHKASVVSTSPTSIAPTYVNLLDVNSCQTASTQYIVEQQIKKLIGATASARLDVYATFEELSLDFIILFGLKKTLASIFKVPMSDVEFSLYSCIATLADHVIEQINQRMDKVVHYCSDVNSRSSAMQSEHDSVAPDLSLFVNDKNKVVSIFSGKRGNNSNHRQH